MASLFAQQVRWYRQLPTAGAASRCLSLTKPQHTRPDRPLEASRTWPNRDSDGVCAPCTNALDVFALLPFHQTATVRERSSLHVIRSLFIHFVCTLPSLILGFGSGRCMLRRSVLSTIYFCVSTYLICSNTFRRF